MSTHVFVAVVVFLISYILIWSCVTFLIQTEYTELFHLVSGHTDERSALTQAPEHSPWLFQMYLSLGAATTTSKLPSHFGCEELSHRIK